MGADNRQLALYNGLETVCSGEFVYFRPDEYITYGAKGLSDIRTNSQGEKTISIFDHLGSVRCSMRQDGTLIGYRDYEPFGAPLSDKQDKTRLGFIDKEMDKESALADHGVRKYDYETGRFTSCDALWRKYLSSSPYMYSANNPLNLLDGNGLFFEPPSESDRGNYNNFRNTMSKSELGRSFLSKVDRSPIPVRITYGADMPGNDGMTLPKQFFRGGVLECRWIEIKFNTNSPTFSFARTGGHELWHTINFLDDETRLDYYNKSVEDINLDHDDQRVEKGDPTTNDPGAISIGYQVENQVNLQILLDKMAGEMETDANKPINVEIENIDFSK